MLAIIHIIANYNFILSLELSNAIKLMNFNSLIEHS